MIRRSYSRLLPSRRYLLQRPRTPQEIEEGQLRVREADAPLVHPLPHGRVEVAEDLLPVEQEEFAARLGPLEADERAQASAQKKVFGRFRKNE